MSATESSAFESKAWLKHYAEWTPTTIEYGDTTLLDFYDNNLAINSDKPAIYFFGRTQTYGEFDKHVRHAAAGLRALGVFFLYLPCNTRTSNYVAHRHE